MANPDLADMLDQFCTIYRSTEGVEGMVTKQGTLTATSTGVACHVQAVSRDDVARGYGYQDVGDHWWFAQSTIGIQRGDMVKLTSGPWSGDHFWARGPVDNTNVVGIEHLCWSIEYTDETLTLST